MSLLNLFISAHIFNWIFITALLSKRVKSNDLNIATFIGAGVIFINWYLFFIQSYIYSNPVNLRQWIINIFVSLSFCGLLKTDLDENIFLSFTKQKFSISSTYQARIITVIIIILLSTVPIIAIHHMPGVEGFGYFDIIGIILWILGVYLIYQPGKTIKYISMPFKSVGLLLHFWSFYLLAINSVSGKATIIATLILSLLFFKIYSLQKY